MSFLRRKSILENVREVTVVIYLDKIRNHSAGMVDWFENMRDLSFNEQVEIWQRRELRSPEKCVKWREVRFGNLSNRLREEWEGCIRDCERKSKTVSDREELF